MANTITGMTFENVALRGLSTFVDSLIPLMVFNMDLSADAQTQGTVVKTRQVPAAGAAGDLTTTHTGVYTAAIADQVMVEKSITLNKQPVIGFAFTDNEMNTIADGVLSDTVRRLIDAQVYAVANAILDTAFGQIDATYGTACTSASSAFDADDVADIRGYCVATGAWRFNGEESLVLSPDYYTAVLKDAAVQDRSASGIDALISGQVPRLSGFRVIEAPSFPGGASGYTVGFACKPEARIIAMRGVWTAAENDFLRYEVLEDDQTGVVLTMKTWFDRTYHKVYWSVEALWGHGDGNTAALARIMSQ